MESEFDKQGDVRGIELSRPTTAPSLGGITGAYVQNLPHLPYGGRDVAGTEAAWEVGTAAGRAAIM
jgi:hypothetical protein